MRRKKLISLLPVLVLVCTLLLSSACSRKENPLEGLWELESGSMDVTYGEGTTLLEFKSNGEIEISGEIPPDPEDGTDSEYEIIRYRTIKIKYEIHSENRLSLSTTQLGETIREEASFSVNGNRLTISGEKSGTLLLIRR
ncbi:MAG: hypothetical protein GX763_00660 [Clostridiaceae bacterium]|nr:hypothetical protein [Clostridiaceae bacterium]